MITAVLIGRRGSKGFPGKNLYEVLGHPLAYYPMAAAKGCAEVDKVYMSTDDERLMDLARQNGVEIINRPPELCTDTALGENVFRHAYKTMKELNGKKRIEMVVLLMCNAPMITSKTISEGIKALKKHEEYDSAVTVSRYNMYSPVRARKVGPDGLLQPFVPLETFVDPKKLNCCRDSLGDVWFADMGVSIVKPRCFENIESGLPPQKWMGQKIMPLKQDGGCDVDYEWQMPMVEVWLKKQEGRYAQSKA